MDPTLAMDPTLGSPYSKGFCSPQACEGTTDAF